MKFFQFFLMNFKKFGQQCILSSDTLNFNNLQYVVVCTFM